MGMNAICRAEAASGGKSLLDLANQILNESRVTPVRTLIWAAMAEHHPEASEADAGKVIDEIGLARAGELVLAAIKAAYPQLFEAAESETAPPPRAGKPAGSPPGTGKRSSNAGPKRASTRSRSGG